MKFLTNNYKKYIAAAATVFAAIAIPAQATDCNTACQNAATQAGNTAYNQAAQNAYASCRQYAFYDISTCMMVASPQFKAAYDQAYQQTYTQCMSSCQ
jgi:hypothetical protein